MDDGFVFTFPVFALLLKDGSGVVALRHGTDVWLPLFTDNDVVQTYLERSKIRECLIQQLSTSTELADFLENPPSRVAGKPFGGLDTVVIDPIDPGPRRVVLFNIPSLIQSLRQG